MSWAMYELENFSLALRKQEQQGLKSPVVASNNPSETWRPAEKPASTGTKQNGRPISAASLQDSNPKPNRKPLAEKHHSNTPQNTKENGSKPYDLFKSLFQSVAPADSVSKKNENSSFGDLYASSGDESAVDNETDLLLSQHVSPMRGSHCKPLTPRVAAGTPGRTIKPIRLEHYFNEIRGEQLAAAREILEIDDSPVRRLAGHRDKQQLMDVQEEEDELDGADNSALSYFSSPLISPQNICDPEKNYYDEMDSEASCPFSPLSPVGETVNKPSATFIITSPSSLETVSKRDQRVPNWVLQVTYDMVCKSTIERYERIFPHANPRNVDATFLTNPSKNPHCTKIQDFELGRPVGSGRFGSIYVARVVKDPTFIVAIKAISKKELEKPTAVLQMVREINHLQRLRGNKNINQLFDHFQDNRFLYLVLEYAPGGDVYTILGEEYALSERNAARIVFHTFKAIQACHDEGVMHRDLKPENLVFGADGNLKLIDFGWSAPCSGRRKTVCGTLDYLAPELVQGRLYTSAVDIWCLGILTFELITGAPPFEHNDRVRTKELIANGKVDYPYTMSGEAQEIISLMLKKDSSKRPTAKELLQHRWITQNCTKDNGSLADFLGRNDE